MTNPNNIIRVRARNGGRASVYEANGWAQTFSTGLLEGNGVIQNTSADLHVLVGGQASKPDVLIAENPAGYKIALDIVGQQAITITTPASNSRISAIVAYTDDLSLSTDQDTVTGSPASCGLIVVNGTAASSPVAPTDAQIRTAITADGATGSQAAYCVIATITVSSATTTITDSIININRATINVANNVADGSITASKMDFETSTATLSFSNTHVGNYAQGPLTIEKWGKMVFITGTIQLKNYSSADDALATDIDNAVSFSPEFAPHIQTRFFGSASGNIPVRVFVDTDGSIGLARASSGVDGVAFKLAPDAGIRLMCAYLTN